MTAVVKKLVGLLVMISLPVGPAVLTAYADPGEESVYASGLVWETDAGTTKSFAEFKGAPLLLTLAYTRCGTACPVTLQRLKMLESTIEESQSAARIAIVSMEPERDTPEALRRYRETKELGPRWDLLRGTAKTVRTLSVILGYSYRADPQQGEIVHANKIVLLDSEGRIVQSLEGLDSDLTPLKTALREVR